MDGYDRFTLGRMLHPVRGILHGSAAAVSVVGLALLVGRAWGDVSRVVAGSVFGLSLVGMFTVSSLYHSVPWTERVKERLQRVDHSMIFVLVAGTATPVAVSTLSGWPLVVALAGVWGVAVVGITLKFVLQSLITWLSITLQILMGFSATAWFPSLVSTHGWDSAWLIVAGGAAYLVGVVVYATRRPRLFPRVFAHHELFHVLVVTASALHFAAVWRLL